MARTALLATFALTLTPFAAAHDLYIVKDGDRICVRVGEHFPASMDAMDPARLETLTLNGQPLKPVKDEAAKQTCAPSDAKSGIVQATVPPRFIRLAGKDFQGYVEDEGLKAAISGRKGSEDQEGRELYSRYAKTLIGATGAATKPLGHVLEIVPETDPASLKSGQPLAVRILFRGKPLAGVKVGAMYAGAETSGHTYPVSTTTDKSGGAVLKLDRPGLWYARLIHMVPANGDPDFDWRSFFATLVFEVPAS
jgi:uncharacterized GH25 family protein